MSLLKKILHIDDDILMRMMLEKSIERSNKGFEFLTCETAAEFIENIGSFKPDLLIIDVVMPVLDGPNLLKKIRAIPNTTPAIFMTGHEHLELENKEKLDPVIGTIHKPFSPVDIGDHLLNIWNSFSK